MRWMQYGLFCPVFRSHGADAPREIWQFGQKGELLKNYFYSREDIESYKKNWVQVFESDDDTRTYWNQEFEAGRITRTMIDVFFDAYFQLFVQNTQFRVSAEDKIIYDRLDRLALSYQDFIKNYCHGDKQVMLAPMAAYAAKFRETFDPSCLTRHMSKTSGLERINVIIFGLKTTTLIPYVLYLTMNVEDQEEYNEILTILEAYVMRRIVTRQSTKNYNNLFVSMILNKVDSAEGLLTALKRYQDSTTSVPSDEMLKAGFNTSRLSNLQAKGVVYFIESGIRTEKSSTALLGFNQYSLEHLMPRKWRNHWNPVATPEEARNRDFKLATLGNFAIITQSLNTSISDGDWKTKKTGKKGNPGLEQCASGLLTMTDVLSEDSWDEEKIENRANWLFEKARELWSSVLPAVDETSGSSSIQGGNRAIIRKKYWSYALPVIQKRHAHRGAFSNCNPTTSNTEAGFFGIGGFSINCIANYDSARIDFWMGKSDAAENKAAFDILYSHKEEIEKELGISLTWERAEEYKASWLSYHLYGVSVANEMDWEKMAEFHAEWSDKICNAVLPFLQEENDADTRLMEIAGILREWAAGRNDINVNLAKCNRTYTRFTTDTMSEILPDIPSAPSGWNTDNHYFYEILNRDGKCIYIQLSISSRNGTEKFASTCEKINQYYPAKANKENWLWRLPYKTSSMEIDEEINKDNIYKALDKLLEEIKIFESDLRKKIDL